MFNPERTKKMLSDIKSNYVSLINHVDHCECSEEYDDCALGDFSLLLRRQLKEVEESILFLDSVKNVESISR